MKKPVARMIIAVLALASLVWVVDGLVGPDALLPAANEANSSSESVALPGGAIVGDSAASGALSEESSGWGVPSLGDHSRSWSDPGIVVHDYQDERPPAGYPFTDGTQYWPLTIYTESEAVRQLVAAYALPGPRFGPVYFLAWVPEPLIPLLERHPDIYRLAWNGDWRPDPNRTLPAVRAVATLGSSRPPEAWFSEPGNYSGVYVFTRSRAVRELVAAQALPSSIVSAGADMVYDGTLVALSEFGFAAWIPDSLIPVLEQHPDVERLEWNIMKMPLAFWI